LITEIVLIFLNSEILSGYEMILVIVCAYAIFLLVFGIYITLKPKHKNIEYLKLYYFAFCFLFCILNLGPLVFIEMMIVTSNILKGEYGEEGSFTSKASMMVHGFAVLPIWILITVWGMYQAYKMLVVQLMIKKQLESPKTSEDSIIISDRMNDLKKMKEGGLNEKEKLSNPYVIKTLKSSEEIKNSVISSEVCKKSKRILEQKYPKDNKKADNVSTGSNETEKKDSFDNNKGTGSYTSGTSQENA
jgi:hypothetical protein